MAQDERGEDDGLLDVPAAMPELDITPEADVMPAGMPAIAGEGENVCSTCGGDGTVDGKPCPECDGTGRVIEKIAGG